MGALFLSVGKTYVDVGLLVCMDKTTTQSMAADRESIAVFAGCIAQETNDSADAHRQIGANWAVSRMLIAVAEGQL